MAYQERRVSLGKVLSFRRSRQHLHPRSTPSLIRICQDLCGVQAQVLSPGYLALWARRECVRPPQIERSLFDNRKLLKTYAMRGTVHLLRVADYSWILTALRNERMNDIWQIMNRFGIEPEECANFNQKIVRVLGEDALSQHEVRKRLSSKVSPRVKAWMDASWNALRPALVEGLICYGKEHDENGRKVPTFVSTERWIDKPAVVSEVAAKRRLAKRYLQTYGPASVQDFARWAGFKMVTAKRTWESLKPQLREIEYGSWRGSVLRKDEELLLKARATRGQVDLLPGFDVYLLSHIDKEQILNAANYKRVYRAAGWISPVVLVDGRVRATWTMKKRRSSIHLNVQAFESFSNSQLSQLHKRMTELRDYYRMDVSMTVDSI